jgi:hypothetical protein
MVSSPRPIRCASLYYVAERNPRLKRPPPAAGLFAGLYLTIPLNWGIFYEKIFFPEQKALILHSKSKTKIMSTRSKIGILNENGTVTGIYCHWDGYLSNNGKILNESYTDRQKVEELISLGDLSSLDHEIGEKHDFDKAESYRGQCNAFGRDRGEKDCEASTYPGVDAFIKSADNCGAQYVYIFDLENKWKMAHTYSQPKVLSDVEQELKLVKESSF